MNYCELKKLKKSLKYCFEAKIVLEKSLKRQKAYKMYLLQKLSNWSLVVIFELEKKKKKKTWFAISFW